MRNTLVIALREIGSYFFAPMFWVLAAGFLFFSGLLFSIYVNQSAASGPVQADMQPLLGVYGTILLFIVPLLSMRLLAEEQRSGRLEILMTAPIDDWQVVLGKWLGAYVMYLALIALTLFHLLAMYSLATNGMALGPLGASYLGLVLLGAALLGVGILTSAITESQVVAAFLGVMAVMILFFLSVVKNITGGDSTIGKAIAYTGLADHFYNFGQGVIDTRDVVYFVTLTLGMLFLATRVMESRRWR